MTDGDYRIAAGYNVALGSLTPIISLPGAGEKFTSPKALPLYEPGTTKPRGDGLLYLSGYPAQVWHWTRMVYAQYAYLQSTFCGGGLSGFVTIYTTLGGSTYSRMNAVMTLPAIKKIKSEYRLQEADVLFTRLVAAS